MARAKMKVAATSALTKGLAYLHKIHKTKNASDFGVVPADPNIYKQSIPHCPTGSLVVDFLIGGALNEYGVPPCPGFPRGRIVQIWGHESSGKTTLALTAAATCIANGGTVLFVQLALLFIGFGDAPVVDREPVAGPQRKAEQIEPPRFVPRRLAAPRFEFHQRAPHPAEQ